ncbi:MAG: outer membrane beta-barrel protein [Deltaproteobacteria bacterium]|jgi:hypothetical protein|nr:outer membrane beta-barrel protein [Deltaproteobacteria bacterium]
MKTFLLSALLSLTFFISNAAAVEPLAVDSKPLIENTKKEEPHLGFVELGLGYGGCTGDDCNNIDGSFGANLEGFYLFKPNIAAGLMFNYQMFSGSGVDSFYTMDFGLAARYIHKINKCPIFSIPMRLFGQLGAGYSTSESEWTITGQSNTVSNTGFFVEPAAGVSWEVYDSINTGLTFKYQLNLWDEDDDGNSPDFNNFFIGLNVSYYF